MFNDIASKYFNYCSLYESAQDTKNRIKVMYYCACAWERILFYFDFYYVY